MKIAFLLEHISLSPLTAEYTQKLYSFFMELNLNVKMFRFDILLDNHNLLPDQPPGVDPGNCNPHSPTDHQHRLCLHVIGRSWGHCPG